MGKKVKVKSLTSGQVIVNVPDLRLRRVWEKKGAVKVIDDEVLQEAIYDPAVEYLFKQGMLKIEDDKVAEEIDPELLEVKTLSETDMKVALKAKPFGDFKEMVDGLSREQVFNLVEFAIQNEIIDMAKNDLLKEKTGIDVTKAVQLKRQEEEVIKTEG